MLYYSQYYSILLNIIKKQQSDLYQNDKEIKPSCQVLRILSKICYELQPAHNELTLILQWNSIYFQVFSSRYSALTPYRKLSRNALFLVIRLVLQKSKTNHISKHSDPLRNIYAKSTSLQLVLQKLLRSSEKTSVVEFIFRKIKRTNF